MEDKRPEPKARKRPKLWQAYLLWNEVVEMRKRHKLRISAIERGKSNMDLQFEKDALELLQADTLVDAATKLLVQAAEEEPICQWCMSIKGIGGSLAGQLIGQIDDIGKFDTVSKLWRFAGLAVIDGKAERGVFGKKLSFNRRLKSICWIIGGQFLKAQTPVYTEVYYAEKERQRRLHPLLVCRQCQVPWDECENRKAHKPDFTDQHLHYRAQRKMVKLFLSHLWETWRRMEGLPVTEPYVLAGDGHHRKIEAPEPVLA